MEGSIRAFYKTNIDQQFIVNAVDSQPGLKPGGKDRLSDLGFWLGISGCQVLVVGFPLSGKNSPYHKSLQTQNGLSFRPQLFQTVVIPALRRKDV
jgi:hypothetical protein